MRGTNRNISALGGSEINTSNDKSLRTQELVFVSNGHIVQELCLEDGWKKKFECKGEASKKEGCAKKEAQRWMEDPLIIAINERKLKEERMRKGETFQMIIISLFFVAKTKSDFFFAEKMLP